MFDFLAFSPLLSENPMVWNLIHVSNGIWERPFFFFSYFYYIPELRVTLYDIEQVSLTKNKL